MERYKNNGFCEFLKEKYRGHEDSSEIRFFDTDKSLLVIADKRNSDPLCLIIDDRVEKGKDLGLLSKREKTYGNECFVIARQSGLPLFWIRYVDCEILTNEDFVYLWHSGKGNSTFELVRLKDMITVFSGYGIKAILEKRTPQKRKNDSLSSAFHLWQRECLRIGIFTDLDLVRKQNGKVVEVIELKRSTQDFDEWSPYRKDYNNFAILLNFCHRLGGVDFHIVFNAQMANLPSGSDPGKFVYYRKIHKKKKGIYYDKIDRLKLYRVERRGNDPHPVLLGVIRIEDFLDYKRYRAFIGQAVGTE